MAWRELITPENSGPATFPNLGPVLACVYVCLWWGWRGGSHYRCTGTALNVSVAGGRERADEE